MGRRTWVGAVSAALALTAGVWVVHSSDGRPAARGYPDAAAVAHAIPDCQPQIVTGKYAGRDYDRCSLRGRTVYVWMRNAPADAAYRLDGPGWVVTADDAVTLRAAQKRLGGVQHG